MELSKLYEWLIVNKLTLNVSKTHFIVFHRAKHKNYKIKIKINRVFIEQVKHTKNTKIWCSQLCLDEKWFRATLLKAASHHIPTGRSKLYTQHVPVEILAMMEERDDLRKQDPASPRLSTMNHEITKATSVEIICLVHKPQDRHQQIVADDQRNWWLIQADGR